MIRRIINLVVIAVLLGAVADASTVYVLFADGQSLSTGNTGCPAISVGQAGGNLMYNGSSPTPLVEPTVNPDAAMTCDNTAVYSSSATYQPWSVVESGGTYYETPTVTSGVAPPSSPWVAVTTKESPLPSALNNFSVLAGITGSYGNNFGHGGVPISAWGSSGYISNMQTYLQGIKAAVGANTVQFLGVLVQGGESDYGGQAATGSTSQCSYTGTGSSTAYYSDSICFQQSVQAMVRSVLGQPSEVVPIIYSQMNGLVGYYKNFGFTCPDGIALGCIDTYPVTSTSSHVAIAQYQLARDSANPAVCSQPGYPGCGTFYLVGPKYHLDSGTNGGPHLSAVGYNLLGAESAEVLSCLYANGFSTNNACGGVMPQGPLYISGSTVTLNVRTPNGLSLASPSSVASNTWSDGFIPVPYYGNAVSGCSSSACQHNNSYGFQFFYQLCSPSCTSYEDVVNNVSVSGNKITITLTNSLPAGAMNLQLAYGFEGSPGSPNGSWGCQWNAAATCDNTGPYFSGGTPHGVIRTVVDTSYNFGMGPGNDLHGDPVYHWMPHFIENVLPQPGPAIISGGACSGCTF